MNQSGMNLIKPHYVHAHVQMWVLLLLLLFKWKTEIYMKLKKILPSSHVGKSKYCLGVMSYNYSKTLSSPLNSCPGAISSGNYFPSFSTAVCSHKPGPHVGQLLK